MGEVSITAEVKGHKERRTPGATSDSARKTCRDATEAEKRQELEQQNEMLNCFLFALTTYCAQVQLRLRQIVDAPPTEKEDLLKDLEEFSFKGIPELKNGTMNDIITSSSKFEGGDLEERILAQRAKQKVLIMKLREELKALKKFTDRTDYEAPSETNKTATNKNLDEMVRLNAYASHSTTQNDVNQLTNLLKMTEIFVAQMKLQISDLERFIVFLQQKRALKSGTCKCYDEKSQKLLKVTKRNQVRKSGDKSVVIGLTQAISNLLCLFVFTQFGYSNCISIIRGTHWGNLRANLEVAVFNLVETIWSVSKECNCGYRSEGEDVPVVRNSKLINAVRGTLVPCIQDLMEHGLQSGRMSFLRSDRLLGKRLHVWQLILLFYERKEGQVYNNSPARKLSQSFDLDIEESRAVTMKQELLQIIEYIIDTHTPYKRSFDSHFKAFICAALNSGRLVAWLRTILTCRKLVAQYYEPWSYVAMTGFEDSLQSLDRLSTFKFDLPVNLAVRRFRAMNEAF
jgi:hypothetical protein